MYLAPSFLWPNLGPDKNQQFFENLGPTHPRKNANFSVFEPKVDALSEKQNSVDDPNIVSSFIGKFSS